MKKLSKNATAKPRKSRRKPELYFVIGGGINRTKCATEDEATEHAKGLLRERAEPGSKQHYTLAINRIPDRSSFQAYKNATHSDLIEVMNASNPNVPKLEQRQCLRSTKPLYIVKVVAVVEMKQAPIVIRAPKGDELA